MAGRTVPDDERMLPCAVSIDKTRRAKFRRLGGSKWLRQQIDAAPEPEPKRKPVRRAPSGIPRHKGQP